MKFLKYFLLATLIHGYPSCSMGQTVDRTIEANYAWGLDSETNLVKNPSAAKNRQYALAVGITLTRDTSAGKKIDNKASWLIDGTALNDYQEFGLNTPPDDLTSGMCVFKGEYIGDASFYSAQVLDGSANVLSSVALTNETTYRGFAVPYACGAAGARKVRVTQTTAGNGAAFNAGKFTYTRYVPIAGQIPNTFSAKVSATGIVSNVTPPGWLTDFSVTGIEFTGTTFKSGLFTQTPNCIAVVDTPSGANFTYSIRIYNTTTSTIGVSSNTSDATTAAPFTITCTKTGSDYQPAVIMPDQTDYDWKDYTPTFSQAAGTLPSRTINYAQHARIGGKLYLKGQITFTATGTWAVPMVSLPSGLVATNTNVGIPASVTYSDVGSNYYGGEVRFSSTTTIQFENFRATNGAGLTVTQVAPFTWASGDTITWYIGPIDIVGWNNVQSTPLLLNTVYADTAVKAEKAAGLTSVDYGTWTPTVSAIINASAVTPSSCSYSRIGNVVLAGCLMSTTCTTLSTSYVYKMTIPTASMVSTSTNGTVGSLFEGETGRVIALDSDKVFIQSTCKYNSTNSDRVINFMYRTN